MMGCRQEYVGLSCFQHQSLLRFPPRSVGSIRSASSDRAAVSASPSSARERRKERNERRGQQKVSWREEVEEKQAEKKKAPPKGLQYELDMTRLTARGMQWWMVLVPFRFELSSAEDISAVLSREFPVEEIEVFVPSVPTKRKMKDGSISSATRRLHSGCVFLRCVLTRRIHDAVKRVPRVRGFFGKKVGFYEQVIMPTPVPFEDIEGMRKKIREEEIDFERIKELAKEERKTKLADMEALSQKDPTINIGSKIRVLSGSYANFEGCVTGLPDANKEIEVSLTAFGEVQKALLALNKIEVLP